MHLPAIISDLAMILLVAGVTTLLFKRINQPLVLGYIIAGFLTGPYFKYFPTIADSVNVSTWSEIGVIFLLFALGLEFSFFKLKSVGSTAFIGTSCEVLGMLAFGYIAGKLLGWNDMNSVFLGGMLSMSSTTIIIKAFDDLKMRAHKFTEVVFGMLIVEDIAGIVMMVMLSTIAVASANISVTELMMSVGRLVFFLVLWFVCGIYIIPTFFKKQQKLMNEETLIVCTIGLCLGMAVLATKMGFSSALGAFIMGSLIAEAPNLHTIEKLVQPIKDLFGAVFFVSVGMLVDPAMLVKYWMPIVVIIAATIIGKLIFSTAGVLLGGKNLHDSVHAGFSLAQIGEFSFIIAGLGNSLGVTSDYLYPIVVAVSVLTTFTTPYFINSAESGYKLLKKILPQKILDYVDRTDAEDKVTNQDSDWQKLFSEYITNYLICVILMAAIAIGMDLYGAQIIAYVIKPPYHLYAATLLALVLMAPFMKALLVPSYDDFYTVLWFKNTINRVPLVMLKLINAMTSAGAIFYAFVRIAEISVLYSLPVTLICFIFVCRSNWLTSKYLNIKSRFLINLNEKHLQEYRQSKGISNSDVFGNEIKTAYFQIPATSELVSKTILGSQFRLMYNCNIVEINHNDEIIDLPTSDYILQGDSTILVVGTSDQMRILNVAIENKKLGLIPMDKPMTLVEFTKKNEDKENPLYTYSLIVSRDNGYAGVTLRSSNIRQKLQAEVIGLVRGHYTACNINPDLIFEEGDLLWLLGRKEMLKSLYKEDLY